MMIKPFTDFYAEHGADLVSREYSDQAALFRVREALFILLGVPPSAIRNRAVLEFGPGSGHYSVFNLRHRPRKYVFVEGVEEVRNALKNRLLASDIEEVSWEIKDDLFEAFESDEKFDLVIAEACIHGQVDPAALFTHFVSFVEEGGILVVTTESACSKLSEILRRLVRDKLVSPRESVGAQLEVIVPVLRNHFINLKGLSRTPEDWIVDNIVQPVTGLKLFSIPDAMSALPSEFSVLGTAPRFAQDFVWYRSVSDGRSHSRSTVTNSYYRNICSILDSRHPDTRVEAESGQELEGLCEELFKSVGLLEEENCKDWGDTMYRLRKIEDLLVRVGAPSLGAFQEIADWLASDSTTTPMLKEFQDWWGMGMQHLSIYRGYL